MRILHVYKTYFPDSKRGIPRVIRELSAGMTPKGFECSVFCLSARAAAAYPPDEASNVVRAKRHLAIASSDFGFSAFGTFADRLRRADIVHYHFPWPQADLMHLICRPGIPAIVTYHSDIVRQSSLLLLYRPFMKRFLNSVDAIVATSEEYRLTSPVLQKHRTKTTVIPIGVGNREPPASTLLDAWRSKLGSDFFLFVGSNAYYKGLSDLIGAARMNGLKTVIAGEGTHDLQPEIRNVENVVLLGEISESDKEALLELCRAFILPSNERSEAFGVVLAEASRAGKPMVTCEVGTGTSFVNRHGETGLIVPPKDPPALADAMNRLAKDAEYASHMGRNARQRFNKHLRAEQMCARYGELYRHLLETAVLES